VDVGKRYYRYDLAGNRRGPRFPALASRVNRIARERADEAVSRVLLELAQSDELGKLPTFARLATTTHFFLDLVVSALLIRA
jgi:hypothetical protein